MAEERLWAPWRLEYIRGPKADECIFCRAVETDDDEKYSVVHRGERCFVILNAYPYNNGHVMVAPFAHEPSIERLEEPVLLDLVTLSKPALGIRPAEYAPEAFNRGINQGKVAGAGVEDHVHLHVVPRWG